MRPDRGHGKRRCKIFEPDAASREAQASCAAAPQRPWGDADRGSEQTVLSGGTGRVDLYEASGMAFVAGNAPFMALLQGTIPKGRGLFVALGTAGALVMSMGFASRAIRQMER